MFMLLCRSRSRLIAAILAAALGLSTPHNAAADEESFERAWKQGDFETVLKELQPLVEAGNEEAIKAAEFAKGMLELQRRASAYRNAEGPIDLSDFDERYEPLTPGPQQRRFALGKEAYDRKDYETAFREWLPLADGGYAEAQHEIADLYQLGWGVEKDEAKADAYYLRAALQGYAPAQAALATWKDPFGLTEDEELQKFVFYWGLRAATNGHLDGYGVVSQAYCRGNVVDKNPVLADVWLYMAIPSESFFFKHRCSENVKYPMSYFNAVQERAEAMSKAYDIPIHFFEE